MPLPRFTAWFRENSSSHVDCTKLASFADPVGKWHEICSVREQFIFLLWLQETNSKQTVEFKNEYTFTEYDDSRLNYSLCLSHA